MSQIPAIKKAKELGYYVITCDYLPNNPGHAFSDEYVNISTVDKEAVLSFAKDKKIDGIVAYASDPAAATAAYVSEKLGLPGNPYDVVKMFSEKDLFREFQKNNGFPYPQFYRLSNIEELKEVWDEIEFPCVVKPVDSSGSKGVVKIDRKEDLEKAVEEALHFSRGGRVIIEQFIETPYNHLHADGVVTDGKLDFVVLGDQRFRNMVPIGTAIPSMVDEEVVRKATKEVARFIENSGLKNGAVNIEVRVAADGTVYIIEIGPRAGGNYIPQLMYHATGQDEVAAVLKQAMGEEYPILTPEELTCTLQYNIGSLKNGKFKEVFVDEYLRDKLVELYIYKKKGDPVVDYQNSNGVVGVAIMKFDSLEERERTIPEMHNYIKVITEEEVLG